MKSAWCLYYSEEHVINYDTLPPVSTDYVPPEKRKVCCGTVSPVRRTFCLVVTFDLIMTCVLWVIYAQVFFYLLRCVELSF